MTGAQRGVGSAPNTALHSPRNELDGFLPTWGRTLSSPLPTTLVPTAGTWACSLWRGVCPAQRRSGLGAQPALPLTQRVPWGCVTEP